MTIFLITILVAVTSAILVLFSRRLSHIQNDYKATTFMPLSDLHDLAETSRADISCIVEGCELAVKIKEQEVILGQSVDSKEKRLLKLAKFGNKKRLKELLVTHDCLLSAEGTSIEHILIRCNHNHKKALNAIKIMKAQWITLVDDGEEEEADQVLQSLDGLKKQLKLLTDVLNAQDMKGEQVDVFEEEEDINFFWDFDNWIYKE